MYTSGSGLKLLLTMKGKAKRKVLTSGRLTGAVRGNQVTPDPRPAACSEPAYSLYSTDSEDQVTTLHKGLDRCAALLSGILHEDKPASPSPPRTAKGGAAKPRISTSLGKKILKKIPTKTDRSTFQSGQRGPPGRTTPKTHRSTTPAAHSGVKLHPPQKQPHTPQQCRTPPALLSCTAPPPQTHTNTSIPLSVHQSPSLSDHHTDSEAPPHTHREPECDGEVEFVPVRDVSVQSAAPDTHIAVSHTHSHVNTCTVMRSNMQLESGQHVKLPEGTHSRKETVQYLLRELKALIAGQGSVAERLLSHLEQTVSSPQMSVGHSNIQTESAFLLSQNTQLHRRVRTLNQQLKEREKAERHQTLCTSEVLSLQDELLSAQSRLQGLQDDLTELRTALQDTQSQLRDRETENALLRTDLEATRNRLLNSEREQRELDSLARQRLEEIENLSSLLQSQCSVRQDPPAPPADRITHYLMSLGQKEPCEFMAAENEGNTTEPRDAPSRPDVRHHHNRSCGSEEVNSTLESLYSDWSMKSGSTFNTGDEAAFRDGLAALDASIASLQKTIQLDLRR